MLKVGIRVFVVFFKSNGVYDVWYVYMDIFVGVERFFI